MENKKSIPPVPAAAELPPEQTADHKPYDDGFAPFFAEIQKKPQYDSARIEKAYSLARSRHGGISPFRGAVYYAPGGGGENPV